MKSNVLGIDIGGVIIKTIDATSDTSFEEDFLLTPPVEFAIETIRVIVERQIFSDVYLISKCGHAVEILTMKWLEAHFFQQTGIRSDKVCFCRERKQKAKICDDLSVTHFVDDRLEVLGYLVTVKNLYLFQPNDAEMNKFSENRDRVQIVQNWLDLKKAIGSFQ